MGLHNLYVHLQRVWGKIQVVNFWSIILFIERMPILQLFTQTDYGTNITIGHIQLKLFYNKVDISDLI